MDSTIANIRSATPVVAAPGNRPDRQAAGKVLPNNGQNVPPEPAPQPTRQQVEQAVQQIQSYLSDSQRQLQFQVDSGSGRTIVRVVNAETQEVIRQIPSEEMLTLARAIRSSGGSVISQLV